MKRDKTAGAASGRVVSYLVTVWVIITLNFLLPRMMPGDPFVHVSGDEGEDLPEFTETQKAYYMEQYGFDDPLPVQYARYLIKLAHGDLGASVYFNSSVVGILARRLPWTLGLVTAAVALSTIIGTFLGVVSAAFRHQWTDRLLFVGLILISEIPAFLMGLVILFIFAAALDLFPLSGAMSHFTGQMTVMEKTGDIAKHAALPVATLTLVRLGGIYLLARNSLLTVLEKDFMVTARAKGLTKIRIFWRHALRNALLPIVTRVFMSLGALVGGAILVENVFNYPGLGKLLRESVMVQDYPLIQGIFLLVTLAVLSANFMADLVYRRLDPRVGKKASVKRQRLVKA
ncbi:ABC transporter permease [Desulfobacter hydrogenophilus]|uniref:ABC transporter permease n=1 Tax=Desulfobacter hydrogenophilus TaxID=2291 RepID=A0A328F7D8_9BACT|nr:ABC transporter permease [Desulfobacter hydrogenophilus]NDY73764.1 ABC transporter permease [Desulfobacter hydrogenophilus]QBH13375.1 ABC transporter permease [Desulfobacter hydrogenophilus]RAM00501.1 ABC transporter permease [Desulfobacter hydrogenophilus]